MGRAISVVDATTQNLILVGAIFGSILVVFLYLKVRLRRQRAELAREPIPTKALLNDRAFNQIRLARAAQQRLDRSGIDTAGIPDLLDRADDARSRGEAETASAFAQSASDSLKRLQLQAPSAVPKVGPSKSTASGAVSATLQDRSDRAGGAGASGDGDGPSASRRLPPNKAESRFQITLLTDDIERASPSSSAAVREAKVLLGDAQQAFDRGQYTEALRLSLKGRRRAGGRIDSLPAASGDAGPDGPIPPAAAPESGPTRCPSCGQPLRSEDKFCRGCGAPRKATRCGQCGEALGPADGFCGACGAPIRT